MALSGLKAKVRADENTGHPLPGSLIQEAFSIESIVVSVTIQVQN